MIKSQITLKQLEAFVFVLDTGTFRSAAAALGTTQPNISSRIANLESALGVTLLHRDAGSVRLTEKGHELLRKSRDVLWAGEALLEEAGRQDLVEERLRLGVTELVACTWLQDFLRRVKKAYPKVAVELQVDLSTRIDERLMEGTLDLAFQTGPFKLETSGLTHLGLEPYIWVAAPDLAQKMGKAPSLSQLFEHPVLTHAKHTQAGMALHDLAKDCGFDRTRIMHSSALSACLPLVCEGFGVGLLPSALVQAEVAEGRLVPLESEWVPEPLIFWARYIAERTPRFVAKSAQLATDAMSAQLK